MIPIHPHHMKPDVLRSQTGDTGPKRQSLVHRWIVAEVVVDLTQHRAQAPGIPHVQEQLQLQLPGFVVLRLDHGERDARFVGDDAAGHLEGRSSVGVVEEQCMV